MVARRAMTAVRAVATEDRLQVGKRLSDHAANVTHLFLVGFAIPVPHNSVRLTGSPGRALVAPSRDFKSTSLSPDHPGDCYHFPAGGLCLQPGCHS